MPSTIMHTRRTYNVSRVSIIISIRSCPVLGTFTLCMYESTKFSFIRSTRIFYSPTKSTVHNCALSENSFCDIVAGWVRAELQRAVTMLKYASYNIQLYSLAYITTPN
uniref:Uncharacterized protein n=1 Tax=Trichogramma kaykai TaxID=54128 RepID=A0ABD2XM37_9HYME